MCESTPEEMLVALRLRHFSAVVSSILIILTPEMFAICSSSKLISGK